MTDEFVEPFLVKGIDGRIRPGDVVLCFNFRTDRCREITQALTQEAFPEHGMEPLDLHYVTMTNYDEGFRGVHVLYDKPNLTNTLGEVVSAEGRTQLRMAETEKYPHVTFFFSGGRETPFDGEQRAMAASPKVATYDLQPEMSAPELAEKAVEALTTWQPDLLCLNFANPDMVGTQACLTPWSKGSGDQTLASSKSWIVPNHKGMPLWSLRTMATQTWPEMWTDHRTPPTPPIRFPFGCMDRSGRSPRWHFGGRRPHGAGPHGLASTRRNDGMFVGLSSQVEANGPCVHHS